MTREEAVTYGNELIQCTTGPLREFAQLATRALRSPGAAEMRVALIEVAARARMNFITTDEAWADRHQPCPMTKIVTPIVDDWLTRHHLPAPGAAEMREAAIGILSDRADSLQQNGKPQAAMILRHEMDKIRALPLPASEVPGEVRAWVASYDDEATAGAHHLAVDDALRDWIRKEYGI